MPIRPKFVSYDRQPYEFPLDPVVQEGKVAAWQDKSYGLSTFIVSRCLVPDMGAEIFLVKNAYKTRRGGLIVTFEQEDLVEVVPPGFAFERDIIDYEGEYGKLVLQHVMPSGHINSLN